jgi:GNAT superfamily N-acetyltransferase
MSGVRLANVTDAPAIAAVEIESWRAGYAGILSDDVLLSLSGAQRTRFWRRELSSSGRGLWVWEEDGGVVAGFGQCGLQADLALPYDGEVARLYVHPDAEGAGIGRQLLLTMLATLVSSNCQTVLVWVLRASPARFFFQYMGAKPVLERRIPVAGTFADAIAFAWDNPCDILEQWVGSRDHWAP